MALYMLACCSCCMDSIYFSQCHSMWTFLLDEQSNIRERILDVNSNSARRLRSHHSNSSCMVLPSFFSACIIRSNQHRFPAVCREIIGSSWPSSSQPRRSVVSSLPSRLCVWATSPTTSTSAGAQPSGMNLRPSCSSPTPSWLSGTLPGPPSAFCLHCHLCVPLISTDRFLAWGQLVCCDPELLAAGMANACLHAAPPGCFPLFVSGFYVPEHLCSPCMRIAGCNGTPGSVHTICITKQALMCQNRAPPPPPPRPPQTAFRA